MMAWSGSICGAMILASGFLIWCMVLCVRLWRRIKKTGSIYPTFESEPFLFPSLPSTPPPTPPIRQDSSRNIQIRQDSTIMSRNSQRSSVRFGGTSHRPIPANDQDDDHDDDGLKLATPRTPPRTRRKDQSRQLKSAPASTTNGGF